MSIVKLRGGYFRALAFSTITLFFAAALSAPAATISDPGFTEELVTGGLTSATCMAWAPDGSNRLFVTIKTGAVRIVKSGVLLPTAFATVSPLYTSSECGLLSICFDPNFTVNHFIYVFATVSSSEQQIIRYTVNGDLGINKTVLIPGLPTVGQNHDGGGISIGPDNKIYWAIGNCGNSAARGEGSDRTSLASKVGRANLDGSAVNDNPYFNSADGISATDYIWASGLRNPFTQTWNPATGKLWVNVVGDGYEQVFVMNRGDYAGDRYNENRQVAPAIRPVIAYATNGGIGGCITGGAFYQATAFPSQYRGNFFYGDFNSGRILRATFDAGNNLTASNIIFANGITNITDICVGPDGALYYVSYGSGQIWRLTANAAAQNLVLSTTTVNMSEGATGAFNVRLATAPAANVTVSVQRTAGDADIGVSAGSTLTFTPGNWSTTQAVTIAAAEDADTAADGATITASSSGLASKTVSVNASDNDTQTLIISAATLSIDEGGAGSFTVRLSNQPTANATVTSTSSGDADVTVSGGASLTFTSANFATPQTVNVQAAEDADSLGDSATVSVASAGIATRSVTITARDNDVSAPIITSTPVTAAVAGAPYSYDVNASGSPTPTYALVTAPSGMTINSSSGVIAWTPAATGSASVTVRAANGVAPDATQSFTITVSADMPPTVGIISPVNNQTVSGSNSEFFGSSSDDVGTVKAEFYVDGILKYTDVNTDEHYHYGGSHNLWNTTTLSNGSHALEMKVYATNGESASQTVNVTVANPGLTGQYFNNRDFTAFTHMRTDGTVNFNWANGSPDPSIGIDTFSARWIGQVQAATSETYTFSVVSDDGARLWVDEQLIVDKWIDQGPTEWSGSIALTAGKKYDVRLDYFENGGGASCQLLWSTPTRAKAVIPQGNLYPPSANSPTVAIEAVSTGKAYVIRTAKIDALMYIDRTSRITSLPSGMIGDVLVRTANDDKNVNVADHLTLSVTRSSVITVAYDKRADGLPTWLSDGTWTATGKILSADGTRNYRLFSKPVTPGNVTLGGNRQGFSIIEAISNYVVIVQPGAMPTANG